MKQSRYDWMNVITCAMKELVFVRVDKSMRDVGILMY